MNFKDLLKKRVSIKAKNYLCPLFGVLALAVALRIVALFTCYDADIGYFMRGRFIPELSTFLCGLCCAASLAFPFVCEKDAVSYKTADERPHSALEYFATAYAAFVILGAFFYEIYHCISDNTVGGLFARASELLASSADNAYAARSCRIQAVIIIIGIISAAISAVYFLLRLNEKRRKEWYVLLGFAPGLRGVSGLARIYFDMTTEMNSPNKLALQIALISVMIYFVFELRMLLGGKKARPRAYAASGLIAAVLTAMASVPIIIGYFAGLISNAYFFTEAFFCFNMLVYIASKTIAFVAAKPSDAELPAEDDITESDENSDGIKGADGEKDTVAAEGTGVTDAADGSGDSK